MCVIFSVKGTLLKPQQKKAISEFSVISDLPPTEEVSDNELEALDELDQEFDNPKSDIFDQRTSDSSFPQQNFPSNLCKATNHKYDQSEFLHQGASINLFLQDIEHPEVANCAQNALTSEYSRPSKQEFSAKNVFSPHSPLSSPELKDIGDVKINPLSTFTSHHNQVPSYPPLNIYNDNQEPHLSRSLSCTIDRTQTEPNYINQKIDRDQHSHQEQRSPHLFEKDRYTIYPHREGVNQSPPDRRLEGSDNYKSYTQPKQEPYYRHSGSDSDLDYRSRVSLERDNSPSQFDRGMMARDRHTNNHRSTGYDSRDPKSKNYVKNCENDQYEANSKQGRRERSISSDRTPYQRDGSSMTKRKDKKSKKSKKNKKDRKSKDYRSGNRKGARGDDEEYDDVDGSPVSSDPELEGRDSKLNYQHASRNRNRSGKISKLF